MKTWCCLWLQQLVIQVAGHSGGKIEILLYGLPTTGTGPVVVWPQVCYQDEEKHGHCTCAFGTPILEWAPCLIGWELLDP